MSKMKCPFCNGENILDIAYSYRGINKRKDKNINYDELLKEGTIYRNRGAKKVETDFDGERLLLKSPNKYCSDCKKEFLSLRILAIKDITTINIIIGSKKERKRLIINLDDKDKVSYDFKYNFISLKKGVIYSEEVFNILKTIKTYRLNIMNGYYGHFNNDINDYWTVKFSYYNGVTESASGYDIFSSIWSNFLIPFNSLLNSKIDL